MAQGLTGWVTRGKKVKDTVSNQLSMPATVSLNLNTSLSDFYKNWYELLYDIDSADEGKQLIFYITYTGKRGFSRTVTIDGGIIPFVDDGEGTVDAITTLEGSPFSEGSTLVAGGVSGDPDGAATILGYQWYLNNTAISGAVNSTFKVSEASFGEYSVAITYRDAQGFSTTIRSSTQTVQKVDNGQGNVSISGNFLVGSTLTASQVLGDPDGIATNPNTVYSWFRDGQPVSVTYSNTYQLTSADLGGKIRVQANYTDGQGFTSSVLSPESPSVALPPDTTSPTITSISVQDSNIILTFSEPIKGSSITPSQYSVTLAGVSRAINSVAFDASSDNRLVLSLSGGVLPSSLQSLSVSYTAPVGSTSGSTVGSVTDLSNNPLQSFTSRAADTFTSPNNIGSSLTSPLQAGYTNATLSGSAASAIFGNAKNNLLVGNNAANRLYGGLGDDDLRGMGGNDLLYGNGGVDTLTGGPGADSFFYDTRPTTLSSTTADRITDFSSTEGDKITVSYRSYGFRSTSVTLSTIPSTSQLSMALATPSVFVYDASTGFLHWNNNGATAGAGTGGVISALSPLSDGTYPFLSSSNIVVSYL